MQKARKFKKKLAQKPIRKKAEPVLSVELIRKETLVKFKALVNRVLSGFKSYRSNKS